MNIRPLEQDNFTTLDTRNPILDILTTALRFLPSICGFFMRIVGIEYRSIWFEVFVVFIIDHSILPVLFMIKVL